ncbi:hypothetical protein [Enterococcus casseliflavus]|uniref:hypothetical protein n=1 Tax=Enterococcus casseliflavus TaxID=37734 RepID=UPI0030194764
MIIVKVQGNDVQENIDYLKYNGYGKFIFRVKEDIYVGLFGTKKYLDMGDVKVLKVYGSMLSNHTTQSELDYLADIGQ